MTEFLLHCQNTDYYSISSWYPWTISSIPKFQDSLFPESNLNNNLEIGFNRSRICWYSIDDRYYGTYAPLYIQQDTAQLNNHYVRKVTTKELYPDAYIQVFDFYSTFDIAFYAFERGPYNFNTHKTAYSEGIDSTGKLMYPETRWGGIMQNIPIGALSETNARFLSGWFMDPFIYNKNVLPVELLIQIGNVSEDILKDGIVSCESSLYMGTVTSAWGHASDTVANNYSLYYLKKDFGLDGLDDGQERIFFSSYLSSVCYIVGNHPFYYSVVNDVSGDNYLYNNDISYTDSLMSISCRYKKHNNIQENTYSPDNLGLVSNYGHPDVEDLNKNHVLDTSENYFQYRFYLHPDSLEIGKNFITDKKTVLLNNNSEETWYKFKIPLDTAIREVFGNIYNVYDADAIRLILRNCKDSIILRFDEFAFTENDLPEPVKEYYTGIYPNPVTDFITVSSQRGLNEVYLFDLQGRLLEIIFYNEMTDIYYYGSLYGTEFCVYEVRKDLSHLRKGIYLLVINSDSYHKVEKIVKL